MTDLPHAARAAIARGVAAYIRATSAKELPATLRPHKNVVGTVKGSARIRDKLVGALEDEGTRALIVHWLDHGKPSLAKDDVHALRLAVERPEGWTDQFETPPPKKARAATPIEPRLEAERQRARRAKEEARRVREESRRVADAARVRTKDLEQQIAALRGALEQAEGAVATARQAEAKARDAAERAERKARREIDKARRDRDEQATKLKAERKNVSAAKRRIAQLERQMQTVEARLARVVDDERKVAPDKGGRRRPLRVPKGRMDDDPETLDEWMENENVTLVVDGYNVAKAEGGFGDLDLEGQRDRVVKGVERIARKKKIYAIVVFDGSNVSPGTSRRPRGPVAIEYSAPNETADDHIVDLVADLPPAPVIVVTNDRELQDRVAVHSATVARSTQLLMLIR